ncbi:MAG: hypothetical protein M3525_02280 [Acidobacteriota bacterium]|nr:hypothetical protein [Acidobacteriota bacterium]
MYCQKCGTQNPGNGRFCRACGTNLGNASSAAGNFIQPVQPIQSMQPALFVETGERVKSNDPDELWSSGIQNVIMGVGFLVVAVILLTTNVAGGRFWWWTMLFPAFPQLGNGISQMSKSKRIAKRNLGLQNQIPNFQSAQNLPPTPENLLYIEQMVKAGRKIEAVKVYRETFGGGLKEAKDAVEKISVGEASLNFQSPDEYVKPRKSIYDTGELAAPPSVIEGTTRHLEINNEGETMTLPKK